MKTHEVHVVRQFALWVELHLSSKIMHRCTAPCWGAPRAPHYHGIVLQTARIHIDRRAEKSILCTLAFRPWADYVAAYWLEIKRLDVKNDVGPARYPAFRFIAGLLRR